MTYDELWNKASKDYFDSHGFIQLDEPYAPWEMEEDVLRSFMSLVECIVNDIAQLKLGKPCYYLDDSYVSAIKNDQYWSCSAEVELTSLTDDSLRITIQAYNEDNRLDTLTGAVYITSGTIDDTIMKSGRFTIGAASSIAHDLMNDVMDYITVDDSDYRDDEYDDDPSQSLSDTTSSDADEYQEFMEYDKDMNDETQ